MTALDLLRRQIAVLDSLLEEARLNKARGLAPVVILDLDDTLLSTAQRHIRILREYACERHVLARSGGDALLLAQVEPCRLRYSIADTASAAGVRNAGLVADLRSYWFDRFFTNDYLLEDEPIAGAPEYCQELRAGGACLVYMTGRDETMRDGTMAGLQRHGFPLPGAEGVSLSLKPSFDTPDLEYKRQALKAIELQGGVLGGFENEPAHVNLLQQAFPDAMMVFVNTKHSGKPVAPRPEIPWIRDFVRG